MITSLANQQIKALFKLKLKKYRDQSGLFLVFGDHLIAAAKENNLIESIYTTNHEKEGILIDKEIMIKLKETKTPFETVAVVRKPSIKPKSDQVLVLADVQDPANVGALIRTAVAFNFTTIIASLKSGDFYNEKTIRASQGALFYANLLRTDLKKELQVLKKEEYFLLAADIDGEEFNNDAKIKIKKALILGNEGEGIKKEVLAMADLVVKLKINKIESLNVGHAGAILMSRLNDD